MISVVTPPTSEPVTVAEVKLQAVIGTDADDALLAIMIQAVREHGEALTNRSFITQTLKVSLDSFPAKIDLPRGPVTAVSSVTYIDEDGDEQTLVAGTDYDTDIISLVGRVQPVYMGQWPTTKQVPNAVNVTYTAGWTTETIPAALKQWLLVRVASLYTQRENHVIGFGSGMRVASMPHSFADGLLDRYTVSLSP